MLKKISVLALAGMLALPAVAAAGAGGAASTVDAQIADLTKQLEALKAQLNELKKAPAPAGDSSAVLDKINALEERAEAWDLASRIQFSGDFRSRLDGVKLDTPEHFEALNVARGMYAFADVYDNFTAAFGALPGAQQAALAAATLGDIGAAMAAGVPVGTATADALAGLNTLSGTANLSPMISVMPSLIANSPAMTFADVSTAFNGMFGTNGTLNSADVIAFMKTLSPADRRAAFVALGAQGYLPGGVAALTPAREYENDTVWSNRFRMNIRAKATENVEFKGRLAMYKQWGMQNNANDYSYNNGMGGGPFMLSSIDFDGASSRQAKDNVLVVDRAFVNWNNVGGTPMWFSIGRRPTSDGPPSHLRMGLDERQATPAAVMDYPFDGLTVGYAYNSLFGLTDAPGRIRFCYGRGFESGPDSDQNRTNNDVDFAGFAWDIYKKGDRFIYAQSYGAFNIFNVPDNVKFVNPLEYAAWEYNRINGIANTYDPLDPDNDLLLGRANLGNIYHTSAVYMDKYQNLNYFVTAAWSKTDAQGMDEMGTSLLGEWGNDPVNKDGYMFYLGARYDIPNQPFKIGAEFNHGTKNWIAFSPGHDDMFQSKLAARGQVYEVYGIWDIPAGEAISKYGKAFMRLGYQHYEYDYTGSGFWLGEPKDTDELGWDPLNAQFYTPIKDMDQVYLTFEAFF